MTLEEIEKIKNSDCPKFSVFARNQMPMPGQKKRLDEIINREIKVIDFRILRSKQKDNSECLQLQFLLDDEVCVLFTGSAVLNKQIKEFSEKIPFVSTIVRVDRYYSFS
jgi:hypothetical protein